MTKFQFFYDAIKNTKSAKEFSFTTPENRKYGFDREHCKDFNVFYDYFRFYFEARGYKPEGELLIYFTEINNAQIEGNKFIVTLRENLIVEIELAKEIPTDLTNESLMIPSRECLLGMNAFKKILSGFLIFIRVKLKINLICTPRH